MKRQREEGCCYAFCKDGGHYVLPRADHLRLKSEWMAGRAFYDGVGFYGDTLTIKLGDIVAVSDTTAEQMIAGRDDKAADAKEDAIQS